jgi:hypothetical protein
VKIPDTSEADRRWVLALLRTFFDQFAKLFAATWSGNMIFKQNPMSITAALLWKKQLEKEKKKNNTKRLNSPRWLL